MTVDEEDQVEAQMFGQVASFYYLKHQTMAVFAKALKGGLGVPQVTMPPKYLAADWRIRVQGWHTRSTALPDFGIVLMEHTIHF